MPPVEDILGPAPSPGQGGRGGVVTTGLAQENGAQVTTVARNAESRGQGGLAPEVTEEAGGEAGVDSGEEEEEGGAVAECERVL